LRAKIFLDDELPKVPRGSVEKVVRDAGMQVATSNPDIGIVVGGDGVFSRYGRTESVPLLFVGVRSGLATGSKAYLAAVSFDELLGALARISAGNYRLKRSKRLEVRKRGRTLGSVYTDVYLQRGAESNCIRYKVSVSGERSFEEAAIGDGVVVTTAAGSTGYYSYLEKMHGELLDPTGHRVLGEDQIGVCHIVPTYSVRIGTGEHPLRYALPWGSRVEISITRPADARLYGVGPDRGGVKVSVGESVLVLPSQLSTQVIVV
jgi:hypothetical protein